MKLVLPELKKLFALFRPVSGGARNCLQKENKNNNHSYLQVDLRML